MWSARASQKVLWSQIISSQHPAFIQMRHHSHSLYRWCTLSSREKETMMNLQKRRCQQNYARLYARRMMELAVASACTKRLSVQLQEAIQKPPSQWENFQRQDWSNNMLQNLGKTPLERWWMAGVRLFSLAALATPLLILTPLGYMSKSIHQLSWDYSLWGIEVAGPTFIKLVQWATTRQDMFSQEFCAHFGKLQDETRGHSWKETEVILKQELGEHYHTLLSLDPKPIGSGCIAQVYRGTLLKPTPYHPTNTQVALKVQHPGIWKKVCVDFWIMNKVAVFLESLPYLNLQYLSLQDTVRQFRDIMIPQLDLRQEARHLTRFNQDFSSDEHVSFPSPLNDLTSSRVLVETFVHGKPILQYTKAPLEIRKELARLGLNTTLKMIFLHDFVHGDLHPGNILVEEVGPDRKMILHLLDCGLVIEMGPDQHENLVKILGAFTRRQGRTAGQLMVDTSAKTQASDLDVELFVQGIEQICVDDADNNFVEKVGDYIADICFLACKHKVKLEAAFINAALAVEITEGIASALYKDIHVQPMALPIIVKAEMMHRLGKFSIL